MKKSFTFKLLFIIFNIITLCSCSTEKDSNSPFPVYHFGRRPANFKYDIVIYGATSAGIIAAEQAVNMGKTVVLISTSKRVGGMTTNGLGNTDVGKASAIGGLALDFYKRIGAKYNSGNPKWTFEPNVALAVFNDIINEKKINIVYAERLLLDEGGVDKNSDGIIKSITMESGKTFYGSFFIDATYEGDLMANASVSYIVGRESNDTYGESKNGVTKNFDLNFVDPYIIKGKPESGLLPRVVDISNVTIGSSDNNIMPYNFRLCMTNVPENRVLIEKPNGYDPMEYELLIRSITNTPSFVHWTMISIPGNKNDMNNYGAFSSDYSGMNRLYPDGDYATRENIIKQHELYIRGLIWTLQNDTRIPAFSRSKYAGYGLAKDEFVENNNWPLEMYVREARRMVGTYVMTESSITQKKVNDVVCLGSYPMDSHIVQLVLGTSKKVAYEGSLFIEVNEPYGISYNALLPKKNECKNLLVPVCISSSHVAFSSIRMEPQFMMLGQASATAASIAIDEKKTDLHEVKISDLQNRLLLDGQVLK